MFTNFEKKNSYSVLENHSSFCNWVMNKDKQSTVSFGEFNKNVGKFSIHRFENSFHVKTRTMH